MRIRQPLEIFFWSRSAIWIVVLLGYPVLQARYAQPLHPPGVKPSVPSDVGWAVDVWGHWDGGWFAGIATHGYNDPRSTTAFFPAYPLTVRAVSWALGHHVLVAGVLVSLAACASAFVLLYRLAAELIGEDGARRTLVYLAVFPTALFFGAVYSESLYLLFAVGAFYAATQRRWALAGAATGLAMLTRVAGVILLPALAVLAWQAPNRKRAFAGLAVALPIAAAWPAWLWATFGHPLEFVTAERDGWQRTAATAGPFGGLWKGIDAGWNGVLQLVAGGNRFPGADDAVQAAGINLESLAALIFVLVLGVLAWRRLGAAYGIFALASVALPLSSPGPNYPLLSMPRFALDVFPAFIALGSLAVRPRVSAVIVGVFAMLLGLNLARWLTWEFVA